MDHRRNRLVTKKALEGIFAEAPCLICKHCEVSYYQMQHEKYIADFAKTFSRNISMIRMLKPAMFRRQSH
jgi:hypothetical protein